MFIRYLAVFLWLALPGLAGAELLQYRYTDTQGQVKEQSPAQRYGNPAGGEVAIALSGGLDRRVRVELWRGSRRVTAAESEVLGSPAKARQVLGNVNNLIAGRIRDAETQQYIADSLPKTRIRLLQPSQGATSGSVHPIAFTGGYQESLGLEEAALFAPEWLGLLPNLEYIALLSGSRVVKGRLPILTLPQELDAVESR